MKTTGTHAFVNQLLVWMLVAITFGGSVGLGTVWMRHQISVTANTNRLLVARIAEVERHFYETKALVAAEQDPSVLRRLNAQWNLGLQPASDKQIVRVNEDPVMRLAARHNRDLFLTDRAQPLVLFSVVSKN